MIAFCGAKVKFLKCEKNFITYQPQERVGISSGTSFSMVEGGGFSISGYGPSVGVVQVAGTWIGKGGLLFVIFIVFASFIGLVFGGNKILCENEYVKKLHDNDLVIF